MTSLRSHNKSSSLAQLQLLLLTEVADMCLLTDDHETLQPHTSMMMQLKFVTVFVQGGQTNDSYTGVPAKHLEKFTRKPHGFKIPRNL